MKGLSLANGLSDSRFAPGDYFSCPRGLLAKKYLNSTLEKVTDMVRSLPIRITLIKPPSDAPFCMQQGKSDLVPPSSYSAGNISFDFTVNVVNDRADGPPNFRGQFVQGPPHGRFIYINSGTYAGHPESCWSRRAKIPLSGITWDLIEAALSKSNAVLEARVEGAARDGGPVCATVSLLEGGWKVLNTTQKKI
jgi:hypothetical protein